MAQKKIGVGVIGTGFGANVQVPGFKSNPEVEVVAICSGRREKVEAAARKLEVPHAFTDYDEMLKLEGLDLVSVVAPPYLHYPMVMAVLEAGKHVLCEKPMALNVQQAREMYRRAEQAGVAHMIDHEFRFVPARARMKELIDEGYLGNVQTAHITQFVYHKTFAPDKGWGWLDQKQKGGGVFGALGSHFVDSFRYWFGDIAGVFGQLETLVKQRTCPDTNQLREVDTDQAFAFMARFQNGALGTAMVNTVAPQGAGAHIEAFGSEGSLVIGVDGKLRGGRKGDAGLAEMPIPERLTPPGLPSDPLLGPFTLLSRRLVKAIREGGEPAPSFYDGMKCQEVMDAVTRSAVESRWVSLPPAG